MMDTTTPRPNFIRHLLTARRLKACRKGGLAIEFAFILPVLLLLVGGIIEVAMVLFVTQLAEGGLREAARYGITGQDLGTAARDAEILDIVADHTNGLVEASSATIDVTVYPAFDNIQVAEDYTDDSPANGSYDDGEAFDDINSNGQWDAGNGTPGPGASGDVVIYSMEFEYEFLTPVFAAFGGPEGTMTLSASIAVRNEPF